MTAAPSSVLAAAPHGSIGLGLVILAVGVLMAFGASLSLRSIWGNQSNNRGELPRSGPLVPTGRPLRSPAVGEMRTRFRVLLSFDFGCLALISVVLLLLGMILIFRGMRA